MAWIRTLPIAVASTGPATTWRPVALAANWLSSALSTAAAHNVQPADRASGQLLQFLLE